MSGWLKTRKTQFKNVKKPILIVCEDGKSSVLYFRAKIKALRLHPADVAVTGESGSAPVSVVDYAIQRKKLKEKEARKNKTESYEFVYCVMDVDDHPKLPEALDRAFQSRLIPIVSNECFELWYLLHYINYSAKHRTRYEIYHDLYTHLKKDYDKGDSGIYALIRDKESHAIEMAKRLEQSAQAESDERNPLRNPSTEVYKLVEKLNGLGL